MFTVVETYNATVIVAIALGIAKGIRSVYMGLVIPNHVPLEKLASASGLQTVLNGIFIMLFAPIIGKLQVYRSNIVTVTVKSDIQ